MKIPVILGAFLVLLSFLHFLKSLFKWSLAFSDSPFFKPFSGSSSTLSYSLIVFSFIRIMSNHLLILILFWVVVILFKNFDYFEYLRVSFQATVNFSLWEFNRLSDHHLVFWCLWMLALINKQFHFLDCIVDILFNKWLKILLFFFSFEYLIFVWWLRHLK